MGVPACGPCSEIHYDRGPKFGTGGGPASGPTGIWRSGTWCSCRTSGTRTTTIIGELPEKNIDTGMGLERVAMVLQDADSMYETDLFAPVLHEVQELSGAGYGRATGSTGRCGS